MSLLAITRSRLLTQATHLALGFLGRLVGSLATAVLLTRWLGPAGYGSVALFLAISWGIYYLSGYWSMLAVTASRRFGGGARDEPEVRRIYWAAMLLGFGGWMIGTALALAASFTVHMPEGSWIIVSATALALLLREGTYAVLVLLRMARRVAVLQTSERIVATLFALALFLLIGPSPIAAMISLGAATVALAGVAFALAPVRRLVALPSVSRAAVRKVAQFSWPLVIMNLSVYLISWVDIIILSFFVSRTALGHYSLAYQVFSIPIQIASAWILAAIPEYSSPGTGQPSVNLQSVKLAARWWNGLLVLGGTIAVAVMPFLFGNDFTESLPIAAALLASVSVVPISNAVVPALIARGRTKELMWISVASAATNIIMDVLLASHIGVWAGVAGTVTQAFVFAIAVCAAYFGLRTVRGVIPDVLPATVALGCIAIFPRTLPAIAVIASVGAVLLLDAARRTGLPGLPRIARASARSE